jgi:integrase
MEWSDVNFESNRITISKSWNTRSKEVKSTKAGYYRNVPMNEELRALLLSLYNSPDRHPERVLPQFWPWLKGTQAKILRGFLELHGLPSVKFHTLRACFATMLLEQKIAPITVMKICGWRDLETMQRYVRLAGLDEQGATQDLSLLPDSSLGDIISFTSKENSIH